MTTTVKQLAETALRLGGFDGLYNEDADCACLVDDLAPCSEMCGNCIAGYRINCTPECDHGPDGYVPGGWHIQEDKP